VAAGQAASIEIIWAEENGEPCDRHLFQEYSLSMERSFVILQRMNEVPILASCTNCKLKFFTPNTYYDDHIGAGEYLRGKFDEHECEGDKPRRRLSR